MQLDDAASGAGVRTKGGSRDGRGKERGRGEGEEVFMSLAFG